MISWGPALFSGVVLSTLTLSNVNLKQLLAYNNFTL